MRKHGAKKPIYLIFFCQNVSIKFWQKKFVNIVTHIKHIKHVIVDDVFYYLYKNTFRFRMVCVKIVCSDVEFEMHFKQSAVDYIFAIICVNLDWGFT